MPSSIEKRCYRNAKENVIVVVQIWQARMSHLPFPTRIVTQHIFWDGVGVSKKQHCVPFGIILWPTL